MTPASFWPRRFLLLKDLRCPTHRIGHTGDQGTRVSPSSILGRQLRRGLNRTNGSLETVVFLQLGQVTDLSVFLYVGSHTQSTIAVEAIMQAARSDHRCSPRLEASAELAVRLGAQARALYCAQGRHAAGRSVAIRGAASVGGIQSR